MKQYRNKSETRLVSFLFLGRIQISGLPVLTEDATFQDLSIGEEFYLAGEPVRYQKTGQRKGKISSAYSLQIYSQIEFEPGWKVWRRIEP